MDSNNMFQPYIDTDGVIRIKDAEVDSNGNIIPDPSWKKFLDDYIMGRHLAEKKLEGPLPMFLNLGDFGKSTEMIGHAFVYQKTDGRKRIEIILDEKTSTALTNLIDLFELKGIGFAGIKRKAEDGR